MALTKYLDIYAEEISALTIGISEKYAHVLCIPAFAESPDFLDGLLCATEGRRVLVIVIANAAATAPASGIETTRKMAEKFRKDFECRQRVTEHIHLLAWQGTADILLVEQCSPGRFLDAKGGVGLARKIACDMACRLIQNGNIQSPWIHTTDADTRLPEDYFTATTGLDSNKDSAGTYPFRHDIHDGDDDHENSKRNLALHLYERSLHYYVAGLKWAGSPWAFHTIGSTLVINSEHYARVRGFPRRQAGEDFYLLEKLAKTGRIISLDSTPLLIDNRLSDRVPFGTGPAVITIMAMEEPLQKYTYYHPACFAALKCWLVLATTLAPGQADRLAPSRMNTVIQKLDFPVQLVDGKHVLECLQALGVEKALAHADSNSTSATIFRRHMENWFDGFMTLKFIHWFRDNHYPSQSLPTVSELCEKDSLPFSALFTEPDTVIER